MSLKADDGTPLQTKEGVVVDAEGHPLTSSPHAVNSGVRSFSFSLPIPAILGAAIFIPIAFALGITFFVGIVALLTLYLVLSSISRFLKNF